jgi:hypothetical protein
MPCCFRSRISGRRSVARWTARSAWIARPIALASFDNTAPRSPAGRSPPSLALPCPVSPPLSGDRTLWEATVSSVSGFLISARRCYPACTSASRRSWRSRRQRAPWAFRRCASRSEGATCRVASPARRNAASRMRSTQLTFGPPQPAQGRSSCPSRAVHSENLLWHHILRTDLLPPLSTASDQGGPHPTFPLKPTGRSGGTCLATSPGGNGSVPGRGITTKKINAPGRALLDARFLKGSRVIVTLRLRFRL